MEIELILKNETRIMYKVSYKPKINSFPYKIVDVCKYLEEEVIQKNMSYGNEIYAQEFQEKTRMYIRKTILNTECGNLHSEDD